jgi:hypothetical protein
MEQARQEAAARQEERTAQAAAAQPAESFADPMTGAADRITSEAAPVSTEPAGEAKKIDLDELDRKLDEILDDKISDK